MTEIRTRVLIVEDEAEIRRFVRMALILKMLEVE